ncbi:MAG: hypothetical protein ACRC1G_12025 [Bradyrhizobium sp.]|nr:hypothetical protein [Bradyrhizobium sp.]
MHIVNGRALSGFLTTGRQYSADAGKRRIFLAHERSTPVLRVRAVGLSELLTLSELSVMVRTGATRWPLPDVG